jgi:hypothetical protein
VEVEALELGLARAAGGDVTEVRLVAEAADAGAGAGAEGDAALDGGPDEVSQDGRGFAEGVGRRAVGCWLELATGEQPPDPGADGGKDLRQVLIARWGHEPLAKPMYPYDSKDAKSMPLAPDLKLLQSPRGGLREHE